MARNAPRKGVAVRSRPARRRTAETRARIMAAGRRLFVDEGWAAFTTRRVAREAGVSLGSLQHFFPCKEQLLAGMLEETARRAIGTEAKVAITGGEMGFTPELTCEIS